MPDKYAQMDGGGSANRPNVKERQRQAAAKNRSVLRSGRTPARPKVTLKQATKLFKQGAREEMESIKEATKALGEALIGPSSLTGRGAAFGTDPTLAMPKTVKPKRKRK